MARDLDGRIYTWVLKLLRYLKTVPRSLPNDVIVRQVLRSGTSIGANYIEAQAASSKKDFANFFHYALKSANETKFWLALCRDLGKGNKEEARILLEELTEIANILGASLLTIKGKK